MHFFCYFTLKYFSKHCLRTRTLSYRTTIWLSCPRNLILWTSSTGIIWEIIRNAESQALFQTHWIRTLILIILKRFICTLKLKKYWFSRHPFLNFPFLGARETQDLIKCHLSQLQSLFFFNLEQFLQLSCVFVSHDINLFKDYMPVGCLVSHDLDLSDLSGCFLMIRFR